MLKLIKILMFTLLFIQCNEENNNIDDLAAWSQINSSNDYWKYAAFIQQFPESDLFDSAITIYFEVRNDHWDKQGMPFFDCFRNCADIRFMDDGTLFFEHEPIEVDSLRKRAFEFILNKNNEYTKPESKTLIIPETTEEGTMNLGIFEINLVLQKLPNPEFQEAIVQLSMGIDDYKNYLAKKWHKRNYAQLPLSQRKALDSLNANRLMFWEFNGEPMPPPPPTSENIEDIIKIIED